MFLLHRLVTFFLSVLAVQRYIYVCHPSLAKTLCTVTKARLVRRKENGLAGGGGELLLKFLFLR